MTEASPVTHMGFLTPELYRPDSAGGPVAQTECRVLDANENEVAQGELGELGHARAADHARLLEVS